MSELQEKFYSAVVAQLGKIGVIYFNFNRMLPRSQRFLRSVHLLKTLLVLFPVVTSCFGIFVQEELKNVTKAYKSPVSPVKWTDPLEAGLWGPLLEDWTLSNK